MQRETGICSRAQMRRLARRWQMTPYVWSHCCADGPAPETTLLVQPERGREVQWSAGQSPGWLLHNNVAPRRFSGHICRDLLCCTQSVYQPKPSCRRLQQPGYPPRRSPSAIEGRAAAPWITWPLLIANTATDEETAAPGRYCIDCQSSRPAESAAVARRHGASRQQA